MTDNKDQMSVCNRKNASSIWNVMTRTGPGSAKCNICGHEFKSDKGTSNLLRHVKLKHIAAIDEHTADTGQSGPSTSGDHLGQQTRVTKKYRPESEKKKALDQKLMQMVYRDMQPFSIVDDAGFQDFCKEMDRRYELPTRQQLKRSLTTFFNDEKIRLSETLSNVDSVAITTDSWASINMESFLTITAHFLEPLPSWELQSIVLATRKVDKDQQGSLAMGMADIISEVLDEFNIKEKLVSATTDNSSSMVNLVKKHLQVVHIRCFAHTLNLIAKDSIKASRELGLLVEAVKKIVDYFHRNAKASAKLKSIITDLGLTQDKLCQDVEVRWNSTLKMVRRYIELHRAVNGALMALGKTELIISDQSVEKMKKFCQCLEPFEEATEMMSAEKRTSLSKVLVVVKQLQRFLSNEATYCQLTGLLISCLFEHFADLEESFTAAAATLLDPRFKRVPFSQDKYRTQHEEKIISMMLPLCTTDNDSNDVKFEIKIEVAEPDTETSPPVKKQRSFMQSFVEDVKEIEDATPQALTGAQAEFERYMGMKFLDLKEDPLQWWQEHCFLFPHLSMIARKYIFIPATSVPSEILFSKAGELISKKRNCLSESAMDMVLFLNTLQK